MEQIVCFCDILSTTYNASSEVVLFNKKFHTFWINFDDFMQKFALCRQSEEDDNASLPSVAAGQSS